LAPAFLKEFEKAYESRDYNDSSYVVLSGGLFDPLLRRHKDLNTSINLLKDLHVNTLSTSDRNNLAVIFGFIILYNNTILSISFIFVILWLLEHLHNVDVLKGHDLHILSPSLVKQVSRDLEFAQLGILGVTKLYEDTSVENMSGESNFSFVTTPNLRLDDVIFALGIDFDLFPIKLNPGQLIGIDRGIEIRHRHIGHERKYLYDHIF
jgi:hypothetical protein